MKRSGVKWLTLLSVAFVVAIIAAPCLAEQVRTVSVEERITDLPNDQAKWYVSVVGMGGENRFTTLLRWFDAHDGLSAIKRATHFHQVTTGSAVYNERYARNVRSLPTVRVQDENGIVVYEASGQRVPQTAAKLYDEIRRSAQKTSGPIFKRLFGGCGPRGCPVQPDNATPPQEDPAEPPVDDGGGLDDFAFPDPVVNEEKDEVSAAPVGVAIGSIVAAALIGAVAGFRRKWRETYSAS